MRGGKREGAGRKGYGPTKTYRLPIALEAEIQTLLERYKAEYDRDPQEKAYFDSVTKSKAPVKPSVPVLNKAQRKRLQTWLVKHRFVKSREEARRRTANPRLCKETAIHYSELAEDTAFEEIADLMEAYRVD